MPKVRVRANALYSKWSFTPQSWTNWKEDQRIFNIFCLTLSWRWPFWVLSLKIFSFKTDIEAGNFKSPEFEYNFLFNRELIRNIIKQKRLGVKLKKCP